MLAGPAEGCERRNRCSERVALGMDDALVETKLDRAIFDAYEVEGACGRYAMREDFRCRHRPAVSGIGVTGDAVAKHGGRNQRGIFHLRAPGMTVTG